MAPRRFTTPLMSMVATFASFSVRTSSSARRTPRPVLPPHLTHSPTNGPLQTRSMARGADYCSLFQHSADALYCDQCHQCRGLHAMDLPCEVHRRPSEHEAAYQRARSSMGILYAHAHTCVWRITRCPDAEHDPRHGQVPYHHRAWPFFETEVSRLIKFAPNRFDLGTASAMAALTDFEGRMPRSIEDLVRKASYAHHLKAGVHRRLRDMDLALPLTPESFADTLRTKSLSSPSDRELLIAMHRKAVSAVSNVKTHSRGRNQRSKPGPNPPRLQAASARARAARVRYQAWE